MKRKNIFDIQNLKGKRKIISISSYHYNLSKIFDQYADLILVGDSLAMTLYGMENTTQISLDTIILHAKSVVNATKNALILVDMPFSTYELSPKQALKNACKIIQETNCQAIKIEGGKIRYETIKLLVDNGIPVVGHIGLLPQQINQMGGFKKQFNSEKILEDALALQEAGAFAIVIECVGKDIAQNITNKLHIPTIGIANDSDCDGQIIVADDLLGLSEITPSFLKKDNYLKDYIKNKINSFFGINK